MFCGQEITFFLSDHINCNFPQTEMTAEERRKKHQLELKEQLHEEAKVCITFYIIILSVQCCTPMSHVVSIWEFGLNFQVKVIHNFPTFH